MFRKSFEASGLLMPTARSSHCPEPSILRSRLALYYSVQFAFMYQADLDEEEEEEEIQPYQAVQRPALLDGRRL